MENSARLSLPYLQAAQAQKHVTHNAALERLDLLVQMVVEEFDAATPPEAPVEGEIWALGESVTGAWAGQAGKLAAWLGTGWTFISPQQGWTAVGRSDLKLRLFETTAWRLVNPQTLSELSGVGVGTSPDDTNRLSVASPATLLGHSGAGHQLKINKASSPDTASMLFQTSFSGRAEMGTTGSDNFAIKVSPDGSTFHDAAICDKDSGAINFPNGAAIAGAPAYHRDNIIGSVSQSGGSPTGALIESGNNADGSFVRFADGTQICWVTDLDMGSILADGSGTWAEPYRTSPVSLVWPAMFTDFPAASCVTSQHPVAGPLESRGIVLNLFETPGPTGWDYIRAARIGSSAHDTHVRLAIMAIGRWS